MLHLNQCTHGRLWSQNVTLFKGRGALEIGLTGIINALVKCVHFKLELNKRGVWSVLTNKNVADWTSGLYLENCTFVDIYVYGILFALVWEITPEVCPRIFKYTLNIILPFLTLYQVHVCYPLKKKNSPFGWHKGAVLRTEPGSSERIFWRYITVDRLSHPFFFVYTYNHEWEWDSKLNNLLSSLYDPSGDNLDMIYWLFEIPKW